MTEAGDRKQALSTGIVRHAEEAARREVSAGTATQIQVLVGPADGAPNFAMRRFIMGPGGGMPAHTNTVEHEQFVLKGRAEVGIGGSTFRVSAGDVLYIPAGVPHYYRVIEGPFEFLCMVPNAEDKIEVLSNAVC